MTSNILHHLRELQVAWRRQDFVFTGKQQDEYDVLITARRQVVRGFYETGRVFQGAVKQQQTKFVMKQKQQILW
jgi:hypothetical protein